MSNLTVFYNGKEFVMNLHEECLLKYLLNPLDLMHSTEMLKLNNSVIEKSLVSNNSLLLKPNINYGTTRI